jgi:multiple sugar transport system substrate-binding protein
MMISGPWQLADLVQRKTPYKISTLPGTNGDHTTISGPDIWALFDHQDANRAYWATQLISWLTAPAQDNRFNLANGNLPLRAGAKDTPQFQQYVKDFPGADVLFQNMANATKPRPTTEAYVELSGHVGKAVAQVLQSAAPAKQALDEAAKQADRALADS